MTEPQKQKNIIILGASYAGISTSHYLLKHVLPSLPTPTTYKLTLISTSTHALCRPACPRALLSDSFFDQEKLFVSISESFKQYPKENFDFINGTATSLNHTKRNVTIALSSGGEKTFDFHALVIATGSSTPSPLLGLNGSVEHLRNSWAEFRKALPNAKRIIIAGGGPAGIETAGELGEFLNGRAGFFSSKIENPKVDITVITSGEQILPALRPALAKKAEANLAKLGVKVVKGVKVESVDPDDTGRDKVAGKARVKLGNGEVIECGLFIPATGFAPNSSFVSKELLEADGRVTTDSTMLRVGKAGERVYSLGSVSSAHTPAIHTIISAVPIICSNIKRDLQLSVGVKEGDASLEKEREFKEDKRETQMVVVGRGMGMHVGAAMGWSLPSVLVWAVKGRDYWLWSTGGLWGGSQWNKAS
ncbi:hypothetical protein B0J14DRAFT_199269 [Halenospora varia]|nr:hypothetical protein B0J14DRAFT_199269 [Halenospora varia]